MIQINKLLFPTDFSELSEAALKYALQFARDYKAELHVIHVVDEAYQYWMSMAPSTVPVGAPIVEDVVRNASKSLEKLVADKLSQDVTVVHQVLIGRPFLEIIKYAKAQSIDLIVIGTHGRGGLGQMLMGSVAEKVVRKAPCPVLTVHHPEREFILP
ncbi:MAG: universal stress protein [Phycisphaerae bacterium]|nr:universal stress protein [Phycisphaerae bacterium]